jgi:hypothetical protein
MCSISQKLKNYIVVSSRRWTLHGQVLDIDLEELPDIFDILDDGDGAITTEESLGV